MAGLVVARRGRLRKAGATGALDDFNRANNASSLGTATTGQPWTAHAGTWGINSNTAYVPSSAFPSTATLDAGLTSFTASIKVSLFGGDTFGLAFRFIDLNNFLVVQVTNSGTSYSVLQVVGGSTTNLGTGGTSFVDGDTLAVTVSGTSITVKRNGATITTTSSSSHLAATRVGLRNFSTGTRFDDFSVAP